MLTSCQVIFTHMIDRVANLPNGASQTLILAHRQELVEQAARHCTNAYPDKSVEIEMGNMHASGDADITIASIASIISKDRIQKFDPDAYKLILIDEAHHIVAPGYLRTLAHFGLDKARKTGPSLVGVSATLSRFDGLQLGAAIDHVVYHKDYIDMIGEKWLSDVIFTTVASKADISKVKKAASGDFQPSDLSKAVNTERANEITVRSWQAKAGSRKSTLVFCVDVAHIHGLTKAFRRKRIDARFVTGETPKMDRAATLDAFRAGEFPVLVNCGVFTEGTDVPNIDCVVLARPTKSRNLLVQMIGRGMRLFPGKENCHVIDMVASLETGIISTPTLFGLDPSEVVTEARVEDMKRLKGEKDAQLQQSEVNTGMNLQGSSEPVSVTFTDYDSVFDLIEDSTGDRHIRAISPNAWVQAARDKYILSLPVGKYLIIERQNSTEDALGLYQVEEVIPYKGINIKSKIEYRPPKSIVEHVPLEDAIHAADTYAKTHYPRQLIDNKAKWRKGPATEAQLNHLNKFRERGKLLGVEDLTKGKAQDMITKLKHGAKGAFKEVEKKKRRMERVRGKMELEEALKRREHVSVGPLAD